MKIITNFKEKIRNFNSSMLDIGEMMVIHELFPGEIILRSYNEFVSLTDPSHVWDERDTLTGHKLLPGESVTLIQE